MDKVNEILNKLGRFYVGFVGDSLTSCEWVHPNWREIVEYVLKEESQKQFGDWRIPSWGIRGFNFGFDGATTRDVRDKTDEIIRIKPDIVIALMGGNDELFNIKPEESRENIEKISKKLTNSGIGVYWSTSLPALPTVNGKDKNDRYKPYAKETMKIHIAGVEMINMFEEYRKFELDKFFTFISEENKIEGVMAGEIDRQHPNQLGNAYVAKIYLKKIFGIEFNPEKYMENVLKGEKLPEY